MTDKKTILITGGNGYIGSMISHILIDEGHSVIVIDRDRKKKQIPGTTLYPFDIANPQVEGIIQLMKPDAIIHLAADHEVGRSVLEPGVFYWNNVANTIQLLNHAVSAGVGHFIFSSSSSVYGDTSSFPTNESQPMLPVSPYGRTKAIVENMLWDYAHTHNLSFASLRYFNAAGADPAMRCGYTQDPASHLIPIVARKAIAKDTVEVYGDTYNTKDGTCERDYTHVHDIATAHIGALQYLFEGGKNDVFNIGSGSSVSVKEIINKFTEVTDVPVNHTVREPRPGDPPKTYADITKAQRVLGWTPKYTIDDIIQHEHQWQNIKGRKR